MEIPTDDVSLKEIQLSAMTQTSIPKENSQVDKITKSNVGWPDGCQQPPK